MHAKITNNDEGATWEDLDLLFASLHDLTTEFDIHKRAVINGEWGGQAIDLEASISSMFELAEAIHECTLSISEKLGALRNDSN